MLEQDENHIVILLIYEFDGTIYEFTIANTLLWSYNELTNEINRTAYFNSIEITIEDMYIQFYQLYYLVQHEEYNLTLSTRLNPLNSETYNSSFTVLYYVPTDGKSLISMEIVKFNSQSSALEPLEEVTIKDIETEKKLIVKNPFYLPIFNPADLEWDVEIWSVDNVPIKFDSLTRIGEDIDETTNFFENTISIRITNRYSLYEDLYNTGDPINDGEVVFRVKGMFITPPDGKVYYTSDKELFKSGHGKTSGHYFYFDSNEDGFYETVYILAPAVSGDLDGEENQIYNVISIGFNYDGKHEFVPYEKLQKNVESWTDFEKITSKDGTEENLFELNWVYHFARLKDIDLLFPKDSYDGYEPRDQIFDIFKLLKEDDKDRYTQLFYETKKRTHDRAWEIYNQQMGRDIVDQVFMTVTSSMISAFINAYVFGILTAATWGFGAAHAALLGHLAGAAAYVASYTLMTKFNIDFKMHEAESRERAFVYYPEGGREEPTSLNDRQVSDAILRDSMPAALAGHPGAYYTTVRGGEPGNMYTAQAIVSPPNLGRMLWEKGIIDIAGSVAYFATLNPNLMFGLDFDYLNLDYELVSGALYSYNDREYYSYSGFKDSGAFNPDFIPYEYRNNTLGYLQQRIKEASGNEFNTIKPIIIDGHPEYIFIDGESELHQQTLPKFNFYQPIIVSQRRYSELSQVEGHLTVITRCGYSTNTEGINSGDLSSIEREIGYSVKIPLADNKFDYPINRITIDVVQESLFSSVNLRTKYEIPSTYYTVDSGNLYFTRSLDSIIFGSQQDFESEVSDNPLSTVYYRIYIDFTRILPGSDAETHQRNGLAQATSYAIMEYFNQYTFAQTTAEMICAIGYTEIMTLISTAISIPAAAVGSWAAQGIAQYMTGASVNVVKAGITQLIHHPVRTLVKGAIGIGVGMVKGAIKEAIEEIVKDGLIEALAENLVGLAGYNDEIAFWVSSTLTSIREAAEGPGRRAQEMASSTRQLAGQDLREVYSQEVSLRKDLMDLKRSLKEKTQAIKDAVSQIKLSKLNEKSTWKSMIHSGFFRGLAIAVPSMLFGSINLFTAINIFSNIGSKLTGYSKSMIKFYTIRNQKKKYGRELDQEINKIMEAGLIIPKTPISSVDINRMMGETKELGVQRGLLVNDLIPTIIDPMAHRTPLRMNRKFDVTRFDCIMNRIAELDDLIEVEESALKIKGENIEDNLIEMEDISEPLSIDTMAEKAGSVRDAFELDLNEYPDISWVLEDHDFVSFRIIGAEPETAIIDAYIPTRLSIPEAEVYIKRRFFPDYEVAGIDIIFMAEGQVLHGSGEINGFEYTSETEISEISAIVSEITIMATQAMWGDRKNLPSDKEKKRGGDKLRNELGYTDNVDDIILTFVDNCYRLFKGSGDIFYNIFDFQIKDAKGNSKYEGFINNLHEKITILLDKHNIEKNLDSVKTFIKQQWTTKATNEDEKEYLNEEAENFFESFINTPYKSSDKKDTVSTIYKAFQINLMHILMEANDATIGIDTDQIFSEINSNLENIDTIKYRGKKVDLDTVFYISIISTLLHTSSFNPWRKNLPHQFSYPTGFDTGIYTEMKGIIELRPQQLLDLRIKGFEQYKEDILFSPHNDEHTINKFFLGSLYEDARDVKYWDCGGISYVTNKESGEYKSISTVSKQKDTTFHSSNVWVDLFNQILRSVKDIKKYAELNMLNFIGEINYFAPMLNTRYGTICDFLSIDTKSYPLEDMLGRTRINDPRTFKNNPVWKKLSSTEYTQYEIIQNLNKLVWESEGFNNSEKQFEDFKYKCLGLIEKEIKENPQSKNYIGFLRDLRKNLNKYYAKTYDNQLNPRWGLVLDASIDSYLTSKDRINLNDLLTKGIKKENIIGLKTEKGNLVGVYVWMYKISTDNEGNKIPIVGLKRIENFERIPDIVVGEGWDLGALVRKGDKYEPIPPILLTNLDNNRLYSRFELENGYLIDKGDTWYRDHSDEIDDSILFDLLSNGNKKMYGIRVLHSYFSRYGDAYHGVLVKMDHINTYLKYGIVIKPSVELCKDLETRPRSRLNRIKDAYKEFKSLENELKDTAGTEMSSMIREAEEFMEGEDGIYELVNLKIDSRLFPREIDIKDETLVKLNAFEKGGEIIEGPDRKEIANIFKRLIGDDPTNEKLYKICFNDFRRFSAQQEITETITGLIYRKDQSLKEWCCEILKLFQEFEPEDPLNPDEIDKIILEYQKALTKKSFSPLEDDRVHFIKNDDYDDFALKDTLIKMMIPLFGRYTVISMLTGTIFVDEGIVRFVSVTYNMFRETIIASGMILPWQYDAIKKGRKMPAMSLFRNRKTNINDILERYYIDICTQSVFFRSSSMVEIGERYYDNAMIKIPVIPLNIWMPAFSRTDKFRAGGMSFKSFLTLSKYNIRKYREWLSSQ